GMTLGAATNNGGTGGGGTGTGGGGAAGGTGGTAGTFALGPPVYVGGLFVADLGTGLAVSLTTPNAATGQGPTIVPVQGPGGATVFNPPGGLNPTVTAPGGNLGGRIVRISPNGQVSDFATGFDT